MEQLGLANAGFTYLMRIRGLAKNKQPITDLEWETVYSTLAQAEIQREFAALRIKELDKHVILSPDFFKIPQALLTPLPLLDPATPIWLSTWQARRDWQDTLQSRIDQDTSSIEALRNAISAVEEATLPALRDALILASDAASTKSDKQAQLDEKAKWITERLLIDAKMGGCQITTRVEQAIETIQTLIFDLRTGQFKHLATFPLSLIPADIDEEWKWIGSYATWRAAMFVFLYPENILQPSLRKYKTPAFENLVAKTRAGRLDPKNACKEAEVYADYFRDICSLEIEATCQASALVHIEKDCEENAIIERNLLFMFGRAASGNIYWSAYDPQDSSGYAQTLWRRIAHFDDVKALSIIGAIPYFRHGVGGGSFNSVSITKPLLSRHICLFCLITDKEGKTSLVFTKFDLEQYTIGKDWNEQWIPLSLDSLPAKIGTIDIVPVQTGGNFYPPQLALKISDGPMYVRGLDHTATTWEGDQTDWKPYAVSTADIVASPSFDGSLSDGLIITLHAVLQVNDKQWFVYTNSRGALKVQLWRLDPSAFFRRWASFTWDLGDSIWLGALPTDEVEPTQWSTVASTASKIYIFYSSHGQPTYQRFQSFSLTSVGPRFTTISDLTKVVTHSGSAPVGQKTFAYQRSRYNDAFYYFPYREAGDRLDGSSTFRAVPRVTSPLNIPERLSSTQLSNRRQDIERAFTKENADAPPSILTYLHEAYYFVPLHLALMLQAAGQYLAALDWFRTVYNYEAEIGSPNKRNIYYGLELDAKLLDIPVYQLADDWLSDPLNPHLIASTRHYAYTRFTIMSLVRCLLDFADSEFTQETPESLPRARTLYLTTLDLLNLPELQQNLDGCDDLIGKLRIEPGKDIPPDVPAAVGKIKEELTKNMPFIVVFSGAVKEVTSTLNEKATWNKKLAEARTVVQKAMANAPLPPATGTMVSSKSRVLKEKHSVLLSQPNIDYTLQDIAKAKANKIFDGVGQTKPANQPSAGKDQEGLPQPSLLTVIAPSLQFCIPPNPLLKSLRMHAELNLSKLRSCRNIAGMKWEFDPYAASTDTTSGLPTMAAGGQLSLPGMNQIRPTLYRYSPLIERAKQLVQLASQIETSMLSALERRDTAAYNLLKARQDLEVARANVRVRATQVTEAENAITLAQLQRDRAQIQIQTYNSWINANYLESERDHLNALSNIGDARRRLAGYSTQMSVMSGWGLDPIGAIFNSFNTGLKIFSNPLTITEIDSEIAAQKYAYQASYERRLQEWQLQESLATQDYSIGAQSIAIAEGSVEVTKQEKIVAELQSSNAKDTVEFLNGMLMSQEMYDWMADVFQGVYRFFLQQATSIAKLAESQLAFERQEALPSFIKADYWVVNADATTTSNASDKAPDRKGLTGSARLLQDIYQLDQYAFDTNKRKLQLSKTISLSRTFPFEFQRFTQTGVLLFSTPMELFDQGFPGHYLRLIRRVRTSVIALIPPTQGIHATLSTTGLSHTVVGPDNFQTIPIRREPEFVALTSPANSTGLFELEALQPEMLLPFEGNGVDMTFEFRMPKAANQLDYRNFADVLITIDYTALGSLDYRQQVIQTLNSNLSADQSFSFRNQFPDQWYDLHNPDLTSTPMTVRFKTFREDFPPNMDSLRIQQVLLYFMRVDGKSFEVPVTHLRYIAQGEAGAVGGSATSIDGIISTRRGNAGSWTAMLGKSPAGEWELALPNTEEMRNRFKNEEIEDILLVITYSGRTPEWPS